MVRITCSSFVRVAAAALAITSFGVLAQGLLRVGHEPMAPDPTLRRYTGKVTALGAPDAKGQVFAFGSVPLGPRSFVPKPGELRAWRMTVLSGKRFGAEFRVSANTDTQVTVKPDKGPIDGLAVNDVFVIESVDESGASMFATPPAAGTPGNT